ncbi:MAG: [protein-PII] uridylyltransferase [Streptosporangiales bacterium]|nr:[protein-PII] uridylyltransferase [Streptosporangiales bacterium]
MDHSRGRRRQGSDRRARRSRPVTGSRKSPAPRRNQPKRGRGSHAEPTAPSGRDLTLARRRLAADGNTLRACNERGRLLADHADNYLTGLWQNAVAEVLPGTDGDQITGVALAAVGGLGRRDAGPTSDFDLVLLHDGQTLDADQLAAFAERLWYPIWDAGMALDHSVRTPAQCREVVETDVAATVGLLDLRLVAGDSHLAEATRSRLLSRWRFGVRQWLARLEDDLAARERRSGEAAHLLEPDLKESRGGLRDALVLKALTATWLVDRPHAPVDEAYEQLVDTRDALQLATGRRGGRLVQSEQQAVASLLDLASADDVLRMVSSASRRIAHALDAAMRKARQAVAPPQRRNGRGPKVRLLGYGVAEHDGEIVLGTDVRPETDAALPLRVAAAAARRGLRPAEATLAQLAKRCPPLPVPWPAAPREALLDLLATGPSLIGVWEALDQAGFPGQWLPEWSAIRCRPQRNPVHRHTVDRHLIETAVYARAHLRDVDRPDLLLLAAWLHDIGKLPRSADHSIAGAPLAATICHRIGLPAQDVAVVTMLVREHLTLVELATRRNLDDPRTLDSLLAAVDRRPDVLELLRALTEADASATGPQAWTAWRARLIEDLTNLARGALAEDRPVPAEPAPPIQVSAAGVGPQVQVDTDDTGHLVTVVAADRPGLFADVAGLLAAHGLTVLEARVTTTDGVAADTWRTESSDGRPPDAKLLAEELRRLATGDRSPLRRMRHRDSSGQPTAGPPPRVFLVPGASDVASVLEVRASDRPALLHDLGAALHGQDVRIRSAHVETFAGQAVDTLYVTDAGGRTLHPSKAANVIAALLDTCE